MNNTSPSPIFRSTRKGAPLVNEAKARGATAGLSESCGARGRLPQQPIRLDLVAAFDFTAASLPIGVGKRAGKFLFLPLAKSRVGFGHRVLQGRKPLLLRLHHAPNRLGTEIDANRFEKHRRTDTRPAAPATTRRRDESLR